MIQPRYAISLADIQDRRNPVHTFTMIMLSLLCY